MNILYAKRPVLCGVQEDFDHWLPGTVIDLPEAGQKAVQIQSSTGGIAFLSVQPDGTYQERPAVGGSYEIFRLDPDLNVLVIQPRFAVYKIAFREQ